VFREAFFRTEKCWVLLLAKVKVKVILRLTVCQSVRLGVEPTLGLVTRCCFPLEGKYLNVVLYFCC
jgi:hypothetical protein